MGFIYIGNGAFVPPYPARDLTAEEVATYGENELLATGLYIKKVQPAQTSTGEKKSKEK